MKKSVTLAAMLALLSCGCDQTAKNQNMQTDDQNYEQRRKDMKQERPRGGCCENESLKSDAQEKKEMTLAPKVEKKVAETPKVKEEVASAPKPVALKKISEALSSSKVEKKVEAPVKEQTSSAE